MTEVKKVAFTTLGPSKKERSREKRSKSVRLSLTLAESNEKFCPEFNYRELVSIKHHERLGKKRLGDVINGPSLHPNDPFASDEDAALKALARQMENKYGSYIPTKKKKRRKENDFSTLGEGYDETDPFIDNSDAFDEVVPVHMETKHRGFYINSGELDFEEVPAESGDDDDSLPSENEIKKRKNRIESDEDVESENVDEDSSKGDKVVHENGIIRPKKRKLDEGELLRKRKKMIGKFNAKNQEKKDSDPETEKVNSGCESKGEVQPSDQSIAASIEAVINKAREEATDKKSESQESASGSDSSSSDSDSSGSSSSSDSDSDEEEEEEEKEVDNEAEGDEDEGEVQDMENGLQSSENTDNIPLPDDLPPDLTQLISKLKEEGHTRKGSSQKFFTDSVNRLLLSIVIKLNKLGGRKKTQIYNHLSQHLPCGTQTIVKRAKNLLAEKQDCKLKEPLKRLKDVVDGQMPLVIEQHAQECQKAAEMKGESGSVIPHEEEEGEDGDKKKCRLPKKKFIFTDEIRKLLCDVVRVRVQFWHHMKKRSETPEEHIRAFLDSDVRPLWPKGWMNSRILYKESFEEHSCITSGRTFKSTPVKKTVLLGGGSMSNVVSSTSSPQPPKPSLTATVMPKNFSPTVSSSPKLDVVKKKPAISDQARVTAKLSDDEVMTSQPSNLNLSIKSVEKINESADKIVLEVKKSEINSSTTYKGTEEVGKNISAENISLKTSSVEKIISSSSKKDDCNVIDLSSDEDKTVVYKVSPKTNPSYASDLRKEKPLEKEASAVSSTTSSVQSVTSTTQDVKKDDNLEEEMNMVMNELLQISKQKTVDGFPEKTSPSKDNYSSSAAVSSSPKDLSLSSKSKEHEQLHYQHSYPNTHSVQSDKFSQNHTTPKHFSSHTSPVKQSLPVHHTSSMQEQKSSSHSSSLENKKQHISSADSHSKHSLQLSSPVQQKQQITAQLPSALQVTTSSTSLHQPKEISSSKSMHQSHHLQPHHTSVSLQKINSQQQSSGMQYSHSQQTISDLPHKSSGNQQYAQPHTQQSAPTKTINVSVSSWAKQDAASNPKNSSESSKKIHSSWSAQKPQDSIQVGTSKISGGNTSHLSNSVSSSVTPSVTASLSSSHSLSKSSGYSTSAGKHASASPHTSSKSSKHNSSSKLRVDPYGSVSQSMYDIAQEQLHIYKQQLQQQKQVNHLTNQQQQEIWQQMNTGGYIQSMSNADMVKIMSQINKMESYPQSSQSGPYPNPGTPTSNSSLHPPYGDASRGNQHTHHISPHHLHPTHGGSDQHHGQY
ncbi:hypothetical protein SK128_014893 [Halocaridina rubra]|uniref:Ubinuclein-1 n=1 Tax=Halocaridina rubra TaxID=373956 RepID=A0AAN9A0V5_HALRR